ncbi:MAG: DMT family transporter [Lachnospiraceae bacterium]|jgi:drug/metabolite transporter (DMT)-like permease
MQSEQKKPAAKQAEPISRQAEQAAVSGQPEQKMSAAGQAGQTEPVSRQAETPGTGSEHAEPRPGQAASRPEAPRQSVWEKLPVVILTAFFCCTLWGSASPAIKIGYQFFGIGADDTPSRILFAGVRFTIAGVMVLAAGSLIEKKWLMPKKTSWKYVAILAVFQTIIHYIFFYMGLAHTSGVRGSIINSINTFFSILLAVTVFKFEKLNRDKVIGSVLGFIGVLIIVTGGQNLLSGSSGGFSLQGEGALLLSAFSGALAGCLIKLFSRDEDPVALSGWQFFIGGLVMILIGLAAGGRLRLLSSGCIPLIIYMGFISAGAYTFWGILLKYNPVSRISVLEFINPVMGVLLSALFLHENTEAFSLKTVFALILVSLGITIVNRAQKEPERSLTEQKARA